MLEAGSSPKLKGHAHDVLLQAGGYTHALSAVAQHALEFLRFSASKPNPDHEYPLQTALSLRLASLHADLGAHGIAELHGAIIADSELWT